MYPVPCTLHYYLCSVCARTLSPMLSLCVLVRMRIVPLVCALVGEWEKIENRKVSQWRLWKSGWWSRGDERWPDCFAASSVQQSAWTNCPEIGCPSGSWHKYIAVGGKLCMKALPKFTKHQSEMSSTYDGCALAVSPLPTFSWCQILLFSMVIRRSISAAPPPTVNAAGSSKAMIFY